MFRDLLMDWKSLIQALLDGGMTQVQIAAACGVAQSSVSDLYRGKNSGPSYDFGRRLEALQAARSPSKAAGTEPQAA